MRVLPDKSRVRQAVPMNPYRAWAAGLAFELAVFIGFLAVLAVIGYLIAWVR